jgi:hypothetical protein
MHRAALIWGTGAPGMRVDEKRGLAVSILVDQSGCDFLKLDDAAMQRSYMVRLQMQWPSALIMIIEHEPQRLACYCPKTIAYESAALMRHHHREDLEGLNRQLRRHGVGLTAYYTALLRHWPHVSPELLWLVHTMVCYLRNAKVKSASTPLGLPADLRERQLMWMLKDPAANIGSLHRQARVLPPGASTVSSMAISRPSGGLRRGLHHETTE